MVRKLVVAAVGLSVAIGGMVVPAQVAGAVGAEVSPVVLAPDDDAAAPVDGAAAPVDGASADGSSDATAVEPEVVDPDVTAVPVDGVDPAASRDSSAYAPAQTDAASASAPAVAAVDPDDVVALGARTFTGHFLVAGVTWDPGQDVAVTQVAVRVREGGTWTPWQDLDVVDVGVPGERPGTEPLISSGADAAQVRVATAGGDAEPAGLRLDVIDPGTTPVASTSTSTPTSTSGDTGVQAVADVVPAVETVPAPTPTPTTAPAPTLTPTPTTPTTLTVAAKAGAKGDVIRPTIVTRKQWGANEKRGSAWPEVSSRLTAMYLHHTAGTNSYTKAQSAAIVRGIYAFHTGSRDWPDIGYQFLVDRFGTIYQGRRDAMTDLPIGAQAGGYNTDTIGVSAMGNFQTGNPPAAMVASVEKVFAWQAYAHGLNATGRATLITGSSTGSNTKAKAGAKVSVPVILGHRDTNGTACPGWRLYEKLPAIRKAVKKQVTAAIAKYGKPVPALPAPTAVAPTSTQVPVQWASKSTYRWKAVKGAVSYQVLTRSSGLTYAMDDDRAWTVLKTVKGTSTSIATDPGRTHVIAVRAIDSKARRGLVTVIGQVTRLVDWSSVTRSASWKRSTATGYTTYRTTASGATLTVKSVKQARAVLLQVARGPATGRIEVKAGSKRLGYIETRSSTTTSRAVVRLDLPASTSGTITLRTVAGRGPVTVVGVAFPRVRTAALTLGLGLLPSATPTKVALSASQAPFLEATSSVYRWKKVSTAVRYEVFVRTAAHGKALPSSWTKVRTTTGTSYRLPTSPSGRTWLVGVRAVGKGGSSAITSFPRATRPVSSALVKRSSGWTTKHGDSWYRAQVWQATTAKRTLTVTSAKSVRAVRLIVASAPGRGRVVVKIGSTTIKTVSTASAQPTAHRHIDIVLPKARSGTLKVTTLDHRTVRISAIVLGR